MSCDLKVGVCGAGYWGKNLIREINKRKQLVCVCELDKKLWDSALHNVVFTQDFDEFLSLVDVVVLATPISTHFALARRALQQNKQVFVEKPLATSAEEAQLLVREAERRELKIFVGHILHYHLAAQTLFQWLACHPAEKVDHIISSRGRHSGRVARSGHLLWDLGPHDISVILRLARPNKLEHVHATFLGSPAAPLEVHAKLLFAGGPSVHLTWTRASVAKQAVFTVVTPNYILTFDDTESQLADKVSAVDRRAAVPSVTPIPISKPWSSPLEMEWDAFEKYVESHEVPYTTGQEGADVVAVLKRIERALSRHAGEQ